MFLAVLSGTGMVAGQETSSPNFVIRQSEVSAVSGGQTSSENFENETVFSPPAVLGETASPSFISVVGAPSVVNESPAANAGFDFSVTCAVVGAVVVLDGRGSSDPESDPLIYTWTGPFSEGGGTATGSTPTVTLGLGISTIGLTVSDGNTSSVQDQVRVSVEGDNAAPEVSAGFSPLATVRTDKGKFTLDFVAADACDPSPAVSGVLITPDLSALEIRLMQKRRKKVRFDLKKGQVAIQAPDPQTLLEQIQALGGLPVANGTVVDVHLKKAKKDGGDKHVFEFKKDGLLKIEAPLVNLEVTAEDASGNSSTVLASAPLLPKRGDDDDDDDDNSEEDIDD